MMPELTIQIGGNTKPIKKLFQKCSHNSDRAHRRQAMTSYQQTCQKTQKNRACTKRTTLTGLSSRQSGQQPNCSRTALEVRHHITVRHVMIARIIPANRMSPPTNIAVSLAVIVSGRTVTSLTFRDPRTRGLRNRQQKLVRRPLLSALPVARPFENRTIEQSEETSGNGVCWAASPVTSSCPVEQEMRTDPKWTYSRRSIPTAREGPS